MKPVKISIEGFNSFLEKQVIDFGKLSSMGIFGIFGPTGSGKSTILDAITFALYGKIARDSMKGSLERYINVHCESAKVVFDFEINAAESRSYRIIREIQRGKGESASTKQLKISLIDIDGREEVLAEKDAEFRKVIDEIIGLQYEDFVKTVVLPQGGFNEFLKLEGAERRKILERLFGLEQYGEKLEEGISYRLKKVENTISEVSGERSAFEDADEESLQELEKLIADLEKKSKERALEKKESDILLQRYKSLYEIQLRIRKLKEDLEENRRREGRIEELKKEVERSKRAAALMESIEDYEKNLAERKRAEKVLAEIKNEFQKLAEEKHRIEEGYFAALEKRESEGEKLLQKKLKLEVLTEDWEEYTRRKEEFKEILKKLEDIESKIQNHKRDKRTYELETEKTESQSKEQRKFIKEHPVDQAELEKLRDAVRYRREIRAEEKRRAEIMLLTDKLCKEREDISERISLLKTEISDKEKRREYREKRIAELQEDSFCQSEYVYKQKERYKQLYTKISELETYLEESKTIKNTVEKEKYKVSAYKEEIEKLKSDEDEKKEIKEKILNENSAALLRLHLKKGESCPVCGRTVENTQAEEGERDHLHPPSEQELQRLDAEIGRLEKKRLERSEYLAKSEESIRIYEEQYGALGIRIKSCEVAMEEFAEQLGTANKKEEIREEKLRQREREFDAEVSAKQKELEEGREDKKRIETKLNELQLALSLALEKKTSYEENIEIQTEALNKENQLLEELNTELLKIYSPGGEKNPEAKLEEAMRLEQEIRDKRVLIEEGEEKLGHLRTDLEEVSKKLQEEEILYARFNLRRENLLEVMHEYEIKLKMELNEVSNPEPSLRKTKQSIQGIEDEYKKYQKAREDIDPLFAKLQKELAAQIQKSEDFVIRVADKEKSLCLKLEKLDILSADNTGKENLISAIGIVRSWLLAKAKEEEKEEEIEKHINRIRETKGALKELENSAGDIQISEEEYLDLKEKNEEIDKIYTETLEKIAASRERYVNAAMRLEKARELLKKETALRSYQDMLIELRKITGAKKFVEFMAVRQLKYITAEATVRLNDITNGAYSLEVDEQGIFKIRDNKNGGCLRNVKTLSGGETFVVSLALALALSAHIQLKGAAPLELFFMDEGFGTLDDELIEVVIESLEKIHHEKLKIGLISHIEYLKQRIPVKLMVSPSVSGEGGSRTEIVYS